MCPNTEDPLPLFTVGGVFCFNDPLPHPDLWNVYGECENFAVMKGHTGSILELHYSTDGRFV